MNGNFVGVLAEALIRLENVIIGGSRKSGHLHLPERQQTSAVSARTAAPSAQRPTSFSTLERCSRSERDEGCSLGEVVGEALVAAPLVQVAQTQQLGCRAAHLAVGPSVWRWQLTPRQQSGSSLGCSCDRRCAGSSISENRSEVHHDQPQL
eukprot:scaffold124367_cov24-Tisochrysis_lutea.AAC.2